MVRTRFYRSLGIGCVLLLSTSSSSLAQLVALEVTRVTEILSETPSSLAVLTTLEPSAKHKLLWVADGETRTGTLNHDLSGPHGLNRELIPLQTQITSMSTLTSDSLGTTRAVVTAANNLRELVLEPGQNTWQLRPSFAGLPDFYTERPRSFLADFNQDGVTDAYYVATDRPGPNTIELMGGWRESSTTFVPTQS